MDYSHFVHQVEFNETTNEIIINRVFSNGKIVLFTKINFSDVASNANHDDFVKFSQILGENLLLDSPIARKKFNL